MLRKETLVDVGSTLGDLLFNGGFDTLFIFIYVIYLDTLFNGG